MADWLQKLLGALVPTLEHSPEAQYAWRWRIAIVTCLTFFMCIGATLLAFGMTPLFGGFAKAGDLTSVVAEIRQNRAANLDSQLLELRIKHCKATSEEAKQLYWSKISELWVEYQRLTGRAWTMPACSDL